MNTTYIKKTTFKKLLLEGLIGSITLELLIVLFAILLKSETIDILKIFVEILEQEGNGKILANILL